MQTSSGFSGFAFSGLNLEDYKAVSSGVKRVTSMPLNGNRDGDLLYDTDIGRLYQWSAPFPGFDTSVGTWSVYLPTASQSDDAAGRYPFAKIGSVNAATGKTSVDDAEYLSIPRPNGFLEWRYIYGGSDNMSFSTNAPNVFIRGGSGTDAIQVKTGRNVLDGGTGSNFLIGGDGIDTFFTDARGAGIVWNTLGNFHTGDAATLWGFEAGKSTYYWDGISGASGHEGATMRADIDGNGTVDASITFSGLPVDQGKALQTSTGSQAAGNYLYFFNNGV